MQKTLEKLVEQNAEKDVRLMELLEQNRQLFEQNNMLLQKIQFLLKQVFGRKSEKLNRNQLELFLSNMDGDSPDEDPPPAPPSPRPRRQRKRKPRMPEDLPIKETIVVPDEVSQDPSGYKCIGEEVTEELDVDPARYFRHRIIRQKFVSKVNRDRAPIIAPLAPRLVEGGYASAGIITDILIKKYVDHLPLYRQERILRERHNIELSRKTMADWVGVAADWLQPIYNHMADELRGDGYLQVDETPVKYARRDGGGCGKGYLWVYHRPGGDVLFEWHTSRAADCLNRMLGDFQGTVQCDGYGAYTSYAKKHDGIELAACWAHARRYFFEAKEESPAVVGWLLHQIGMLYAVESRLRERGPVYRQAMRTADSAMILKRIGKAIRLKQAKYLPKSATGKAINYALGLWSKLERFIQDGRVEIDNNLVENSIRPTAIGRKNYLFFGDPAAGQRSAIIYSLLESCRRHGVNPHEYLLDVLTRLPSMTNQQTHEMTPARWAAANQLKMVA